MSDKTGHVREKCLHSELFCPAFSCIRTEYGEIRIRRSIYPLLVKENEITSEINKLLEKKVIIHKNPEKIGFISRVSTRNKKNGNKRVILNLKNFNNRFVLCKHYKWNPSIMLLTSFNLMYI